MSLRFCLGGLGKLGAHVMEFVALDITMGKTKRGMIDSLEPKWSQMKWKQEGANSSKRGRCPSRQLLGQ